MHQISDAPTLLDLHSAPLVVKLNTEFYMNYSASLEVESTAPPFRQKIKINSWQLAELTELTN
jgi:hypothetical protein